MSNHFVINHSRKIKYCYSSDGILLKDEDIKLNINKARLNGLDLERHISNGLFTLRRPGTYQPIAGICAIPPRTSWVVEPDSYSFAGDIRLPRCQNASKENIFSYGNRLQKSLLTKQKIAIELSGGLDSSILIQYFLGVRKQLSLIGFISDRYEFRTERAVQDYYAAQCEMNHLLRYEEHPAFAELDKVPPHPFPVQESLFFSRHKAVAEAARYLGINIVISGEAGDQLLGFEPELCDFQGRPPSGFAYWNLAELWSHQYVYTPRGVSYVSGLASGHLPSAIIGLRSNQKLDIRKLWVRRELRDFLPRILTEYAYKAFHDGWVVNGLIEAAPTIERISRCAFDIIKHELLNPTMLVNDALNYRTLDEKMRSNFLSKLSFAVWIHSNKYAGVF